MAGYHDDRETRDAATRARDLALDLPDAIVSAKRAPAMARALRDIDPDEIRTRADLARLPITRKSELSEAQAKRAPFGGYTTRYPHEFDHIFQSPGPLYQPGRMDGDWWRMGRFLSAAGVTNSDIMQNCFSYHLTPAGMMFESGARALGCAVLPAGTAMTDLQVRAAVDVGCTVYAGTPDFLQMILARADEIGAVLAFTRAVVQGGALEPALRQAYAARGIATFQCYATADLGNIAYETEALDGMVVDEGVIVEIVSPSTGTPVPDGEVGEVVVTTLNPDYPLIRFATGDLSAVLPGESSCGRTNMRIRGWMGSAG